MAVAGKIKQLTLLLAGILFVGGFVNAHWLMVCSTREMVTKIVKQMDLGVARSIMEAVGIKLLLDAPTLLAWIMGTLNACALLGSKVMALKVVKISMNAKRGKSASVLNAAARTPGVAMSALAVVAFCI